MSQTATPSKLHVPSITISVAIVVATGVLGGLGATACWLAGVTPATSGALGLIAALAGSSVGIAPWVLRRQATAFSAAATQLFSATVRMLVGLAMALMLLLTTTADRPWLLGVFLVATLAGLAAELFVLMPILRALRVNTPHTPTAPHPHAPETAG